MGFETVKLKDLTINLDNKRKPLNELERKSLKKKGLYPYCGANGVLDYIDEFIFDQEILCIAEDGGSWGFREKCAYIMNEPCWVNNHAHVLVAKENVNVKYLCYYLNYADLSKHITGTTRGKLTKSALEKIEVKIPDYSTQNKIVNALDKAQELIDKRKAQIEALDQLTQSVFLEMFGSIQGEKLPLSELCEINPPKREVADLKEDTIVSFIPMANVSENGEIDLSETRNLGEVYKGFTYFKENDVLFAKITPCMENGKGAIAKNLTNEVGFGSTEFHVLRPKEGITSEWLYYLTTLPKFRQQAEKNMTGSAGQKRVPKQFFDKYKVNKPTIESQEEFKKIILKINSQKEMLKKSLAILDTNFQSLMQRAFKGELFTEEKVSNL
ncbi:restriction endonuclease subunit S [Aeribacillus sp. FSL M8-0254]|uniref:restriction endonuclease subunit S n=1 Tax=Aeribacillus sp. FSL M8-0254 TaxID=2954577 RepID=UPI0030F786FA